LPGWTGYRDHRGDNHRGADRDATVLEDRALVGLGIDTIERVNPKTIAPNETTGWQTLQLHLERYRFASRFAQEGSILDIACGVGYGTHLLASLAAPGTRLIGVDIAADALAIARSEYAEPGIEYFQSDCMTFASDTPFDTIVSLETLEHLAEPEVFLKRLVGMLAPGGRIVFSVPITPSVDINPYHRWDFTRSSALELAERNGLYTLETLVQVQAYSLLKMLMGRERRLTDTRKGLIGFYARMPDKAWQRCRSIFTDGFRNKYLTIATQPGA
jgi:2-polyprenyl-3-methyl-5-hydroxy-6-metoxy-1,4-benzoquinol methylase